MSRIPGTRMTPCNQCDGEGRTKAARDFLRAPHPPEPEYESCQKCGGAGTIPEIPA